MDPGELCEHSGWDVCTFEGARRDTLLRSSRMTLREKLEWLEEAETLALRMQQSRARQDGPPPGATTGENV